MSFENLLLNYGKLIKHMEENSYSKHCILLLKTEINWLGKNGCLGCIPLDCIRLQEKDRKAVTAIYSLVQTVCMIRYRRAHSGTSHLKYTTQQE